ncbi:MAG: hypothetical protein GY820_20815 [Gammaproteobacteria bacterium]|nr:hypothetical protein [Gammaproteobacteria bacterium]
MSTGSSEVPFIAQMLEGAGYQVIDLGVNKTADAIRADGFGENAPLAVDTVNRLIAN